MSRIVKDIEVDGRNLKALGLEFDMTAYIVKELGETEHGPLDAIIGALTMEEWYIKY